METDTETMSFEESLARLETVAQELDRGQLPLQVSLQRFEEGISLLRRCREFVETAEARVLELVEIDAEGHARLRPLEHEATIKKSSAPREKGKRASRKAQESPSPQPPAAKPEDDAGLFADDQPC